MDKLSISIRDVFGNYDSNAFLEAFKTAITAIANEQGVHLPREIQTLSPHHPASRVVINCNPWIIGEALSSRFTVQAEGTSKEGAMMIKVTPKGGEPVQAP